MYAITGSSFAVAEIRIGGELVSGTSFTPYYGADPEEQPAFVVLVRVARPKRAPLPRAVTRIVKCWPASLDAWRGDR